MVESYCFLNDITFYSKITMCDTIIMSTCTYINKYLSKSFAVLLLKRIYELWSNNAILCNTMHWWIHNEDWDWHLKI